MEPDARYTIVGAFVLAGALGMIFFILWITKANPTARTKSYAIYFREQTLDGLQVNSSVTMKGIKVGYVESVNISPKNIEEVRVVAVMQDDAPIKVDTRAAIQRNLLTGLASIDLVGSTEGSPPLLDSTDGEPFPVIAEGRTQMQAVTKSLPDVFSQLGKIVERVNDFLTPENQAAFTATLKNIEVLTGAFASESDSIRSIIRDTQKAVVSIERLSSTGHDQLAGISDSLQTAMDQLNGILENVDRTTGELSSGVTASTRVLVQQFQEMAHQVSTAARGVASSSEELRNLPKAIYGPQQDDLGPGESLR